LIQHGKWIFPGEGHEREKAQAREYEKFCEGILERQQREEQDKANREKAEKEYGEMLAQIARDDRNLRRFQWGVAILCLARLAWQWPSMNEMEHGLQIVIFAIGISAYWIVTEIRKASR
jgi:hypothetical protein